jgi:hypothetical protein
MLAVLAIAALLGNQATRPSSALPATSATPTVSPTQTPDTSRLHIIVTVKSSVFCTSMKTMTLPIGYITRVNEDAMSVLADDGRRLAERYPTDDDAKSVNTWSRLTAAISMEEITYQLFQNLVAADNVMNESWRRFPRGTDSNIDSMRQRLQNVVDLQRALVNEYVQVTHAGDSCVGERCSGPGHSAALNSGDLVALADLHVATDPEDIAEANAHDIAHFGSIAAKERQLDLQEAAFSEEIKAAGHTCGL